MPRTADHERWRATSTRLKEWGTSRAVRVPRAMCHDVGIATGSELVMETGIDDDGPYILIRPVTGTHRSFSSVPAISMDEAFADYAGTYQPHEADWGADVGAERLA